LVWRLCTNSLSSLSVISSISFGASPTVVSRGSVEKVSGTGAVVCPLGGGFTEGVVVVTGDDSAVGDKGLELFTGGVVGEVELAEFITELFPKETDYVFDCTLVRA
jgi:hypothetical protein